MPELFQNTFLAHCGCASPNLPLPNFTLVSGLGHPCFGRAHHHPGVRNPKGNDGDSWMFHQNLLRSLWDCSLGAHSHISQGFIPGTGQWSIPLPTHPAFKDNLQTQSGKKKTRTLNNLEQIIIGYYNLLPWKISINLDMEFSPIYKLYIQFSHIYIWVFVHELSQIHKKIKRGMVMLLISDTQLEFPSKHLFFQKQTLQIF